MTGIVKRDAVEGWVRIARGVHGTVIHIVALNAFVHHAESTAYDRLSLTGKVVSTAQPRPPIVPGVVDQTFGDSVYSADPDPVQIELYPPRMGFVLAANPGLERLLLLVSSHRNNHG